MDGGLRSVRVVPAVIGDLHHLPGVVGGGKVFLQHRVDILGLPPRCGIFAVYTFRGLRRLGGLLLLACAVPASPPHAARPSRAAARSPARRIASCHITSCGSESDWALAEWTAGRAWHSVRPCRRFKGILTRESSCCGASGQTWGRCGPRSRCGRCPRPRSPPVLVTELEVPDGHILLHALPVDGLGDDGDARWTFHRRATCAALLPYFWPMALSTGWVKMPWLPSAKGPQASGWTPYCFIRARAFSCWKKGCSSTWLTAGLTSTVSHRSAKRLG